MIYGRTKLLFFLQTGYIRNEHGRGIRFLIAGQRSFRTQSSLYIPCVHGPGQNHGTSRIPLAISSLGRSLEGYYIQKKKKRKLTTVLRARRRTKNKRLRCERAVECSYWSCTSHSFTSNTPVPLARRLLIHLDRFLVIANILHGFVWFSAVGTAFLARAHAYLFAVYVIKVIITTYWVRNRFWVFWLTYRVPRAAGTAFRFGRRTRTGCAWGFIDAITAIT